MGFYGARQPLADGRGFTGASGDVALETTRWCHRRGCRRPGRAQPPRSADVVANKDSILLKISTVAFGQLLREAPALPAAFLLDLSRSVVGRVRDITKRYVDSVSFIRASQRAR